MAETNLQKFVKHCKAGGLFYAISRGVKYVTWRNKCKKMGIDCGKFSRER
ncbi:MAG: hypothetical protein Q7O04_03975 [Candidatus Omnitrophota bacterium]|nr:hypothetical protein [Candidatus Omnitrophota bacterium]